jgi:SAM-dependent methyltransferase
MSHPELERLANDFGWDNRLVARSQHNAFDNPNWSESATTFSDDQSESLSDAGSSSWWYETRNKIIFGALIKLEPESCLWDIGSGPGVVSSYLSEMGMPCVAVEPSLSGVTASAERGVTSIVSDLESLYLPSQSVGMIGLFDVLEHIEDRQHLLAEIGRVLTPSGKLIITVPALQVLWSSVDVDAGHFLRYSKRVLDTELKESGFQIQKSRYFFALLVLPLLLLRAIPFRLGVQQLVEEQTLLNQQGGLMSGILQKIEIFLSKFTPFGTSLLVVATKLSE